MGRRAIRLHLVDPRRRDSRMTRRSRPSRTLTCSSSHATREARDCGVLLRTHAVAAFAVVDGFPSAHVECLAHRPAAATATDRRPRARFVCVVCAAAKNNGCSPLTKTACRNWAAPRLRGGAPTAATSTSGRSTAVTSTFDTADARCTNAQASSKARAARLEQLRRILLRLRPAESGDRLDESQRVEDRVGRPHAERVQAKLSPRPRGRLAASRERRPRARPNALALNDDRLRTSGRPSRARGR